MNSLGLFQFLYGEYLGYGSASKKESHMLFLHHNVGMLHEITCTVNTQSNEPFSKRALVQNLSRETALSKPSPSAEIFVAEGKGSLCNYVIFFIVFQS